MIFPLTKDNVVLSYIAQHPESRVQDIHQACKKEWIKLSQAQMYNVVNQYLDAQLITKHHGKISLNSRRIDKLHQFTDLVDTYYGEHRLMLPDSSNPVHAIHTSSLAALDPLRNDSVNKLLVAQSDSEEIMFYNSHEYHLLGFQYMEKQWIHSLTLRKPLYFLIGNTTFLDRLTVEQLQEIGAHTAMSDDHPFEKQWLCLNIIGDYIIEVYFPPSVTDYFSIFFENITTLDWFNPELFTKLFTMKADCRLSIKYAPEKAAQMSAAIKKTIIKETMNE